MNERERRDLIEDYLRRLARELNDVPAPVRRELLEDVRAHIEEAWAASPEQSRAALLNVLERLGPPEVLAREERERLGLAALPPEQGPDLLSVAAIVLTVFFWPLGLLLAWLSPRWYTRDKAIATAIPVLGLILALSLTMIARTSGGPVTAVVRAAPVTPEAPGRVGPPEAQPAPQPTVPATQAPQPIGGTSPWVLILAAWLALYGVVGAPLTSALYLALRMRPRPRRPAVVVPAVASVLLLFLLLATYLTPVTVQPGPDSGPGPASAVPIPTGEVR